MIRLNPSQKTTLLTLSIAVFSSLLLQACGSGNGGSDTGDSGNGVDSGSDNGGDSVTETPSALTLSLTPTATKTFTFSWNDVAGESEYRLLENPDGMSGYSQIAVIPANSTEHNQTISSLPRRVNASYILQACNSESCTDSEKAFVTGSLAEAVGYFKASNTKTGMEFGTQIALSADGRVMAVGAPLESVLTTGVNGDQTGPGKRHTGAVYLFTQSNGVWSQQAYIKASNTGLDDRFGSSLALSADGSVLAVGAPGEDSAATGIDGNQSSNSAEFSGAVYVFTQSGDAWSQQAYIKASNTGAGDGFGGSLSLSADGNVLAVGAPGESSNATGTYSNQASNAATYSGAVYVFGNSDGAWSQQVYIKASNTEASDLFGSRLSLSADGRYLAVSAMWEDSLSSGINGDSSNNDSLNSGAVYVFHQNDNESWLQQAYVKASNPDALDAFGDSLALSSAGDLLVVGASGEGSIATGINGDQTNNSIPNSGAVYVFSRNEADWSQQVYIKASNPDQRDLFGGQLALSQDGSLLAVSATGEDSHAQGIDGDQSSIGARNSGAVYLFTHSSGNWAQQSYVKASTVGESDRFGQSVALSADGELLAVGANDEDSAATGVNGDQTDNSEASSGAVYLY